MKRNFLLILLMLALLLPGCVASAAERTLQLEIQDVRIMDKWEGETSDTHVWLVVQATVTNWRTETVALSESIQAQLIIQDAYVFDATPEFGTDNIDSLVQLNGALLFRIPRMAAELLDEAVLRIGVDGNTVMEGKPDVSKRTGAFRTSGSLEGPGFDTAEEAALAYIEAFNAGDVPGMLSTFAIETYVDHVDRAETMNRVCAFVISSQDTNPMPTPYVRDLLVSDRYGEIAQQLRWQYFYYAMPEAYGDDINKLVQFTGDDRAQQIQDFLGAFDSSPVNEWIGNIAFVGFVPPEDLIGEIFMDERNQRQIKKLAVCSGCDEIAELILHIRISGEDFYQCLECARYGDRWYVQSLTGNAAILLGMSPYSAGLVPADVLP